LRRKTREIYYYTTPAGYEVDFYLPKTRQLIQVVLNMDHPATREREIRALLDAMRALDLSKGLILTDSNAERVAENGLSVEICSLAEWLLDIDR
jgi:predicted AAA+ superfamily ATPase